MKNHAYHKRTFEEWQSIETRLALLDEKHSHFQIWVREMLEQILDQAKTTNGRVTVLERFKDRWVGIVLGSSSLISIMISILGKILK